MHLIRRIASAFVYRGLHVFVTILDALCSPHFQGRHVHRILHTAFPQKIAPHMSNPTLAQNPPRSANTKCNVAPPSRLYSDAILSSALYVAAYESAFPPFPTTTKETCANREIPHLCEGRKAGKEREREGILRKKKKKKKNAHLFPAVDEPLLHGGYPFFFLHALLYAGDLGVCGACVSGPFFFVGFPFLREWWWSGVVV